jgi:hypothetical protein
MKREEILRAASMLFPNGLGKETQLFTASRDEWLLRDALERWTAENMLVCYGADSPQPPFIVAALKFGNLALMQREWIT